jgi:alkyl hydroperoxide reductase subunit AhpC
MASFHEWKKGKWAILFSHPADFTPVCTTEIGRLALKYDDLQRMDCLVATLSVDPVKSHQEWLQDVVAHCENEIEVSRHSGTNLCACGVLDPLDCSALAPNEINTPHYTS